MTASIASILNSLTVLRWATVIVILQVIYLVLELAFNARLVDSVAVTDAGYFEYLAHVGRVLSGAGCTLLGFSMLRKWKARSVRLRIAAHCLLAVVTFPLVYHGQEMLIDALVDRSTAEQRVHAQYIALLKRGLTSNAVVFKDVEFTAEDIERPEAKTFINTIGFAVFFAPDYIQSVAENSDQILHHLAIRQSNDALPGAYKTYLSAHDEIATLSARYNEANLDFEEQVKEVEQQAKDIWREIFVELQDKWKQVQADTQPGLLRDGLDQLYDRLDLYFIARARCTGRFAEMCLQKVNKEYNAATLALFGKPVAPEYWCKPLQQQTNRVLQGGQFVEVQQAGRLDCSSRHRDFIKAQFLSLHGVSSVGYDSFEAFMASTEVAREIRERLAKQHIVMPENYRLRSYKGFLQGVEFELTKQLAVAFSDAATEQFGVAIAPRLSTQAFLRHPVVQAPLRSALELDATAAAIAIDLSERAFRDEILVPQLEKQLAQERVRLLAKTAYFADGEPYAEDGKTYVRSVLIPPMAMGLSLFFGLLNLASLGAALLSKARLPAAAILVCKLAFIVVLVLGPLLLSSQIAQTEPFQKIVDETQTSLGLGRYFVTWLTSLQPLIHPLGAGLADVFHLFEPTA